MTAPKRKLATLGTAISLVAIAALGSIPGAAHAGPRAAKVRMWGGLEPAAVSNDGRSVLATDGTHHDLDTGKVTSAPQRACFGVGAVLSGNGRRAFCTDLTFAQITTWTPGDREARFITLPGGEAAMFAVSATNSIGDAAIVQQVVGGDDTIWAIDLKDRSGEPSAINLKKAFGPLPSGVLLRTASISGRTVVAITIAEGHPYDQVRDELVMTYDLDSRATTRSTVSACNREHLARLEGAKIICEPIAATAVPRPGAGASKVTQLDLMTGARSSLSLKPTERLLATARGNLTDVLVLSITPDGRKADVVLANAGSGSRRTLTANLPRLRTTAGYTDFVLKSQGGSAVLAAIEPPVVASPVPPRPGKRLGVTVAF